MPNNIKKGEQEHDINDVFSDIALTENLQKHQGYEEGFHYSQTQSGQEGYELGYNQGKDLGKEFGSIYGYVIAQERISHSERTQKTLALIRENIDNFPRENDPEKDIIKAIENIRNSYKKLETTLIQVKKTPADGKKKNKDFSF